MRVDPFVALQQLLPKHGISRLLGLAAELSGRRSPASPLVRFAIASFARTYAVDLSEAVRTQLHEYDSFNDFFTRALRGDARPIDARAEVVVSPSDGRLGQHGPISEGSLLQAKGHRYSLRELLADERYARSFEGGYFATIYLAPRDYHRVHTPEHCSVGRARYLPGALFSVNPRTEAGLPGLFAHNERLVCELATARGSIALTMVGALIVAGIRAVWQRGHRPDRDANAPPLAMARGEELGQFQLGSTVILCMPPGRYALAPQIAPGAPVRMGAPLLLRI